MVLGKKSEPKVNVREKLADGWLRAIITFELVGRPRKHVEETLKAHILNIKGDTRLVVLAEEWGEPIETDGLFSAFCELEALVENMETLSWLAINFMPASIEILEPENPTISGREITNWYNDLLAKLNEVNKVLIEHRALNTRHTESLNALIQNGILAALSGGEKTEKEIGTALGIQVNQLQPFLKHLEEKEKIVKKAKKYLLRGKK